MNKRFRVRGHYQRSQEAKRILKEWEQPVNFIDRAAFVEFLLLEDVATLCNHRLEALKNSSVSGNLTHAGELASGMAIKRFTAISKLLESAKDVAYYLILSGDYKTVWKAIPERALISASRKPKDLAKLGEISIDLLEKLQDAKTNALIISGNLDEQLEDIERHDANTELYYAMQNTPSEKDVEEVIKAVEDVIPGLRAKKAKNTNANLV